MKPDQLYPTEGVKSKGGGEIYGCGVMASSDGFIPFHARYDKLEYWR